MILFVVNQSEEPKKSATDRRFTLKTIEELGTKLCVILWLVYK